MADRASYALLFPGLGSQGPSRPVFTPQTPLSQRASHLIVAALGWNPWTVSHPQPRGVERDAAAMARLFVECLAGWEQVRLSLGPPKAIGAYSAGLFPALVVGGAASVDVAVDLMVASLNGVAEAAPLGDLLGVVGLDRDRVEGLLAREPDPVYLSHDNGPGHLILGGRDGCVESIGARLEDEGVFSLRRMDLGAPYHTPLMSKAAEHASEAWLKDGGLGLESGTCPILTGVAPDGVLLPGLQGAQQALGQLSGAIRWPMVTQSLRELGVDSLFALGAGEGLLRWTARLMPKVRRLRV